MELELDRAAINRANALHSTGPKTDEGKQRSSVNAWKHGLYSRSLILPSESQSDFRALSESLYAEHQPQRVDGCSKNSPSSAKRASES